MGCWAISKKEFLHAQQKLLKQKSCKLRGAIKNRASAFYSPGPVFDVKKNSCTNYCPTKKNHAQPKGEKKNSCNRKLPTSPPPPQKNNGASLKAINQGQTRLIRNVKV